MQCNICSTFLDQPIYESEAQQSLTSLCELRPGKTRVWSCPSCGHILSAGLSDAATYYESDYRILLSNDDEDQIYETDGERIVYRTDHQISTLLKKLDIPENGLLLDYGCAKGHTPKLLLNRRPDLSMHLFDVSSMYASHWDRFVSSDRQAINDTPAQWNNYFDIITSFFALEHINQPQKTVNHIAQLLKRDGVFYGIVPDTFGNIADFVVVDHINHFTISSLHTLLSRSGFVDIQIDPSIHRGALVFSAKKGGQYSAPPSSEPAYQQSLNLAVTWKKLSVQITRTELALGDAAVAIYGSGFYGAYIASTLKYFDKVYCFLDRSPFQQGKVLLGKPILAPEELPPHIRTLYVGLNPKIARAALATPTWLAERDLNLVFLDGEVP